LTVEKLAIKIGSELNGAAQLENGLINLRKEETESAQFKSEKLKKFDGGKKRFIITWAQNTPVHKKVLKNIKNIF
jgi:hypothetical protein